MIRTVLLRGALGALLLTANACAPPLSSSRKQQQMEQSAAEAVQANDLKRATAILEPRAESGDVSAQSMLARILMMDRGGLPKNASEAARWNHRAAQQGAADAQLRLAEQFARGDGVQHDAATAYVWAARAALAGLAGAQERRAALGADLTAIQRGQADQIAAAWAPKAEPGPLGGVDPAYAGGGGAAETGGLGGGPESGGSGQRRAAEGDDRAGGTAEPRPTGAVRF